MLVTINWLKEFVEIKTPADKLCEQLTMLGLEVEELKYFESSLSGKDAILKLDITPNRGDCFSILGVAREIAALNNIPLRLPRVKSIKEQIKSPFLIKTHEAAPRYVGRYIDQININQKIPSLIKERLKLSGIKSIDPIVDITNYVLLELGQPLHAFDADKLQADIEVRFAEQGEKISLLNEEEIKLTKDCLVISDKKNSIAFAGIMGGKESGISTKTKSILLESAFFKPNIIRGKARRFGLQTDASMRFERGVDYNLQKFAIERASSLIKLHLGGFFGPIQEAVRKNHLPKKKLISLDSSKVNKLLGASVPKKDILDTLGSLGITTKTKKGSNKITSDVPPWRFDLSIAMDLIEEIARCKGYDKISPESLKPLPRKNYNNKVLSLDELPFLSFGYNEVITYSFIDEISARSSSPKDSLIYVSNPISSNMSVMRPSLLPGLLQTFIYNSKRGSTDCKIVELGRAYKKTSKTGVEEKTYISGLISGYKEKILWSEKPRPVSFFDLKGHLEAVYSFYTQPIEFKKGSHPFLHPGKTASINLKSKKNTIGVIGSLNPKISERYDLKEDIYLFEILAESLEKDISKRFKDFSRQPSIHRDLSFVVDNQLESSKLIRLISKNAGKNLVDLEVFDVYEGKGIPKGKKSLAFALTWQSKKRTLEDKEVDVYIKKIVSCLSKELGAKLRD